MRYYSCLLFCLVFVLLLIQNGSCDEGEKSKEMLTEEEEPSHGNAEHPHPSDELEEGRKLYNINDTCKIDEISQDGAVIMKDPCKNEVHRRFMECVDGRCQCYKMLTDDGLSEWMTYDEEFEECVVMPGKLCSISEKALVRCQPPTTCSQMMETEEDQFHVFFHCTSKGHIVIGYSGQILFLLFFTLSYTCETNCGLGGESFF